MPTYLTEYEKNGKTFAGPKFTHGSWDKAARSALAWSSHWDNPPLTIVGEFIEETAHNQGDEEMNQGSGKEMPLYQSHNQGDEEMNQGSGKEMPLYQSHKQVRALKIKEVIKHARPEADYDDAKFEASDEFKGAHLLFERDGDPSMMLVNADWYRKHKPEAGGYYVVYEDDYASFIPAKAFEKGYTLISSTPEPPKASSHPAPTVGRVVHYYNVSKEDEQPKAAIITKVWSDTCVNLTVFPDGAGFKGADLSSVNMCAGNLVGGCWEWPPRV